MPTVPDKTARDAIGRALRQVGVTYYGVAADAVLAALGIPPTTTTSEISAGLAALRIAEDTGALSVEAISRNGGRTTSYAAESAADPDYEADGASPAAAIHALNAKLEERADG